MWPNGQGLCFPRPSAHWVFVLSLPAAWGLARAPVLVLLVRTRGPALRLGVRLLDFTAVVCAVTPVPSISSLCKTIGGWTRKPPKTHT